MKREHFWRMLRALLDGGVQWLTVGACLQLCRTLLSLHEVVLPGAGSKMPLVAKWVDAAIPNDQTGRFFLLLLPGLVWCAWIRNPLRMEVLARFYLFVGLIAFGAVAGAFKSTRGLLLTEPEPSMFQIDSVGEAVFVVFCFAPLMIAALTHFRQPRD